MTPENSPEKTMEHSREPWEVLYFDGYIRQPHIRSNGSIIGELVGAHTDTKTDQANAARIVACVNFCAGLSNETMDELKSAKGEFEFANKKEDDLHQQLAAAKPAIDFCAGIHVETLTLLNQANHPTLTQICEENQSLRKQLVEAKTQYAEAKELVDKAYGEIGLPDIDAELAKNKAAKELLANHGAIIDRWLGMLSTETWTSQQWYLFNDIRSALRTYALDRALIQPEEKNDKP